MRPWILRAIPAFVVPVLLVAAVAACGTAQQSTPSNQTGERLQKTARAAGDGQTSGQVSLTQPARIAFAQEEDVPAAETEPAADMPAAEDPAEDPTAAPAAQDEQPPVSEAPAPVSTVEPAPSVIAVPTDTAPMAGAPTPTPTIDLSRVLEEPAIQTAVAQISNMVPPSLPVMPNQTGQPQGAPPAAQTQAAIMMATLTTR